MVSGGWRSRKETEIYLSGGVSEGQGITRKVANTGKSGGRKAVKGMC